MNNPADTLAALAPCPFCGSAARLCEPTCDKSTPYKASHRAFPVVRCNCGAEVAGRDWDQRGTSAIAAWNRRASLKGEAEPGFRDSVLSSARFRAACYKLVGIVEGVESQGRQWVSGGQRIKDAPEWCAFYVMVANMQNGTTPPAPQAVVEAINWSLVREGLDYFDRAGDAGDKLYVAEIRKALGQPSPAPQGGGELRVRHIGGGLLALYRGDEQVREIGVTPGWDFRDRDEFIARYNATPPAQQTGEVGEAIRRMDECRAGCDAGDPFYADAAAWDTIRAFLAPKEKGNG